jgi:hypothetical protein
LFIAARPTSSSEQPIRTCGKNAAMAANDVAAEPGSQECPGLQKIDEEKRSNQTGGRV